MLFTFDPATGTARVRGIDAKGSSWDTRYEGFSLFDAWVAANRDGFLLAPGASFDVYGPTEVVRA